MSKTIPEFPEILYVWEDKYNSEEGIMYVASSYKEDITEEEYVGAYQLIGIKRAKMVLEDVSDDDD